MNTTIFYYTGTGNSLWVARSLAGLLGNSEVIAISDWMTEKKTINPESIGIVFPVHIWGVPDAVIKFTPEIIALAPRYLFALAVNAGQVSNTLVQLKNIYHRQGMMLHAGFDINMPSNYIPWGGAEPEADQKLKFEAARNKLATVAKVVKGMESRPVERGPLWQRLLFTALYNLSFSQIPKMDRDFWVDEKCNQCEICLKVCPTENISMAEGKPVWHHGCQQCLACLQWCPREAIQYGKKTAAYARYHHPEIKVKDILHKNRTNAHKDS